jgi:putative FmdB family regulatory protein
MPIYEYRCPQNHLFEVFQRMTDPPVEVCEVCGQGPVQRVLYPVAVHFKGSGFYTTDYGRGSKRPKETKDASSDGGGEKKPAAEPKKAAEA